MTLWRWGKEKQPASSNKDQRVNGDANYADHPDPQTQQASRVTRTTTKGGALPPATQRSALATMRPAPATQRSAAPTMRPAPTVQRQAPITLRPAPAASGDSLTVQAIMKSFGKRLVVKGVSISVGRGESVGLLGPNGAGKTTVFYMITGLIKPDKGRVLIDGYDVTKLPMYRRARLGIGYLPQEASIFRGLTVEQNIMAVLEIAEPSKRERERRLDELLDEFHITRLRKSPSIALSGGERRRVEIARALASNPSYMLLDEPFAGIDPIAIGDIRSLVRHLTKRGIGVLITDHNVRETLELIDRAYIIYDGKVLTEGSPAEIVKNEDVKRVYLGDMFAN
jgi:lipopolysaccharide export system ATP-binding protein